MAYDCTIASPAAPMICGLAPCTAAMAAGIRDWRAPIRLPMDEGGSPRGRTAAATRLGTSEAMLLVKMALLMARPRVAPVLRIESTNAEASAISSRGVLSWAMTMTVGRMKPMPAPSTTASTQYAASGGEVVAVAAIATMNVVMSVMPRQATLLTDFLLTEYQPPSMAKTIEPRNTTP